MDPSMMMPGGMPGAPGAASEPPPDNGKMTDLVDKIDKSECYARNEAAAFPWTNLLIGDDRLGCQSDADEQLILHIAFNEFVKVHSMKLTEFNGGRDPELQPTKVHLYVNRTNMGFEDTDDVDPTQSMELTAADLKEDADPIRLQFVKFQRVRSITIFIEDNAGGDVTALGGLKFFGRTVATTNMKDFKKQPGAS
uniref:PITH domain-containing protein n=1 Tax=Trieres chinensis TaxID=1514140 RepID=A0A7S1ZST6_TRICV|mmetsp:Transcript_32019/g.65358  ORF Transcript_32019/g.65358 Transcript_32019/m.65358 type:complete len:195 (+) Transcript_32019:40-624(+)|eukprot:CAMPEP_0183310126 /NCGR_PEP_ID=MMETSP0160_2-20130417/29190_1 /TAXON_ID=2839 ORGANISM="Odontella Sinensis, Strain Grunow 1884" /NCGR_SAMPLE_ID=MMETSP0160_2 /ASSEMBLY_ACC=CAM_ASM_000250 /LENGTH=194 /DNA_ID=CAMNT_0025474293 /DNA_START=81 /DNA_END=665 /DNA_ORIENTATION=-